MKNIFIYFIFILITSSSCTSYLITELKWNKKSETFFQPPSVKLKELHLYEIGHYFSAKQKLYLIPPYTGNYYFAVSGHRTKIFLSTDKNVHNKKLLVETPNWTGEESWYRFKQQRSKAISLKKGGKYYMEIDYKENSSRGNADHYAVAWSFKKNGPYKIITNKYLKNY